LHSFSWIEVSDRWERYHCASRKDRPARRPEQCSLRSAPRAALGLIEGGWGELRGLLEQPGAKRLQLFQSACLRRADEIVAAPEGGDAPARDCECAAAHLLGDQAPARQS